MIPAIIDPATAGIITAAAGLLIALWKGVPDVTAAIARRDNIVRDTYGEMLDDVREQVAQLKLDVENYRTALALETVENTKLTAAIAERDETIAVLKSRLTSLDKEVHRLREEVDVLRARLEENTPGPQGTPGEDGATGQRGVTGTDGAKGATGAEGAEGARGARGPQGEHG